MSLAWGCEVCEQPRKKPCINTIQPGSPLPGRGEHLARVLPPGRTKPAKDERNEAIC